MLANTLDSGKQEFNLNYESALSLFIDTKEKIFGIYNICRVGRDIMKKEPGDWYGVNSIA